MGGFALEKADWYETWRVARNPRARLGRPGTPGTGCSRENVPAVRVFVTVEERSSRRVNRVSGENRSQCLRYIRTRSRSVRPLQVCLATKPGKVRALTSDTRMRSAVPSQYMHTAQKRVACMIGECAPICNHKSITIVSQFAHKCAWAGEFFWPDGGQRGGRRGEVTGRRGFAIGNRRAFSARARARAVNVGILAFDSKNAPQ
jgi:hypothetical protein